MDNALLEQFIKDTTNKPNVGNTTENRGECVGVSQCWIDVLGYPHVWGNASDLLGNADPAFYEVVRNETNNFPSPGDILVMGSPYGRFTDDKGNVGFHGHTGVVVKADVNNVTIFQQNDPVGSLPYQKIYNYSSVIGWLHPKPFVEKVLTPPTGNINTHGLDLTNADTLQVLLDTWDDVARKNLYVKRIDYDHLAVDLETVKRELLATQKGDETVSADMKSYREMVALGYATMDDIRKALKEKDDININLIKDMALVEQKNKTLADLIARESQNSYTAIDEALAVIKKVDTYEEALVEIAHASGAKKVSIKAILEGIFNFRETAERFVKKLDEDEKAKIVLKSKSSSELPKSSTTISLLMKIFGLKGVEK